MIIDLHLHTAESGPCRPEDLVAAIQEAKRVGLDAICVTEHDLAWHRGQVEALAREHNFPVFRGMEVSTDLGHILVFGLDGYVGGIHRAAELRRVVRERGGYMIAAHPLRRKLDGPGLLRPGSFVPPTLEEAAAWPLFHLVDALEVLNGATAERENEFAGRLAAHLGLPGSGGSDAHSLQGIGYAVTIFEGAVTCEAELVRELRAGRFCAAWGREKS